MNEALYDKVSDLLVPFITEPATDTSKPKFRKTLKSNEIEHLFDGLYEIAELVNNNRELVVNG